MWHSHMGNEANCQNIIQALEECGGGADIIATLGSSIHPSPFLPAHYPHLSPAPSPTSPPSSAPPPSSNSLPSISYFPIQFGIVVFLSIIVAIFYFHE